MARFSSVVLTACVTLLVPVVQSCSQVPALESEPQPLGNGTVRTFVELDEQNAPKIIGVILSPEAMAALPDEAIEVVLPLPDAASKTAFTHVGLNWQNHGHTPSPIYGVPHFDFHFYTLEPEERDQITAVEADLEKAYQAPSPESLPAGYVMAPDSAEPRMGAHWIDPAAEEFQGHPHGFAHTLIYGYYNGKLAFIEPMVSLDFLNRQASFEGALAVPQQYEKAGAYPTAYRVTYNEATGEHVIALTGLTSSSSASE